MTAQTRYITSLLSVFSTFLENLNVSRDLALLTTEKFIVFTTTRKQNDKNWAENWQISELEKFITTQNVPHKSAVLMRKFVKNYTPLEVDVYLHEFLTAIKADNRSDSTIKNYRSDIQQFANFSGRTKLQSLFDPQNLRGFVQEQLKQGLQVSTIKRKLSSISQFALWAETEKIVTDASFWISDIESLLSGKVNTLPHSQKTSGTSKTASQELEDYLISLEIDTHSDSTIKNYKSDIGQFLEFSQETELQKIISQEEIAKFVVSQKKHGLKMSSIKRKVTSITQFALWAESRGAIHGISNWIHNLHSQLFEATPQLDSIKSHTPKPEFELRLKPTTLIHAYDGKPQRSGWSLPVPGFAQDQVKTEEKTKENQNIYSGIKGSLQEFANQINTKRNQKFLPYINLLMMIVFVLGLGFLGYQQFILQAPTPFAYPSTPVRPNRELSFQGRLTDTAQNPITVATDMAFRLYDTGPGTGGTQLWSSGTCSVTPDQDGIFSVGLGDDCGSEITQDVFTENSNVWLEVDIEAETLDPRQSIKTVAYALNSETVQGYPISATGAATVNTILTMDAGGQVLLGEVSPILKSTTGTFAIEAQTLSLQTSSGSNGDIFLSPDGTGTVIVQSDLDLEGYLHAPGATFSATYAGGTALIAKGGPSGTANIQEWQNSAGTALNVVDENGNVGIGTSEPQGKITVSGTPTSSANFGLISIGNGNWAGAGNDFASGDADGTYLAINSDGATRSYIDIQRVGNTIFKLDQSGNVGIANSNPLAKLDITGDQRISGILTGVTGLEFDTNDSSQITFSVNNSEKMRITTGGNLGIGSTTPGERLDVVGNLRLTGTTTFNSLTYTWPASQTPNYVLQTDGAGALSWVDPAGAAASAIFWNQSDGALYPKNSTVDLLVGGQSTASAKFAFINNNSGTPTASISGNLAIAVPTGANPATTLNVLNGGTFNLTTSAGGNAGSTSRLYAANNGNVGVGTTGPTNKFHVYSANNSGYIANEATGTSSYAGFFQRNNTDGNFNQLDSIGSTATGTTLGNNRAGMARLVMNPTLTSVAAIGTANATPLVLATNNAEVLRITSAGNIGIGSVTPGYKLDVVGDIRSSGDLRVTGDDIFMTTNTANYFLMADGTNYNPTSPADARTGLGLVAGGTGDIWVEKAGDTMTGNLVLNDSVALALGTSSDFTISHTGTNTVFDNTFATGATQFQLGTDTNATAFQVLNNTGTNLFEVDGSGNVGIGSASPGYTLDLVGEFNLTDAIRVAGDAGTSGYLLTSSGGGANTWTDPATLAGANYWRLNSGTLSPYNDTLDLLIGANATTSAKFAFMNVNSGTPTASISGNLALAVPTGANPATTYNVLNGGSFNLTTSPGGDAGATSRLFVANSGNIGINTTNPQNLLHIVSSTANKLQLSGSGTDASYIVYGTGSTTGWLVGKNTSGNFRIENAADTNIGLAITGAGLAGINDPNPGANWQVDQAADGQNVFQSRRATDSSPTGNFLVLQNAGGSTIGSIDINSNMGLGGAANSNYRLYLSQSGTSQPAQLFANGQGSAEMRINGSGDFEINGLTAAKTIVFNQAGSDVDLRVEGDTNANLLFVDASGDNIGIGTSTVGGRLQINGGGTGIKSLLVRGNSSNDANIQEWQNGSGTALSVVDEAGWIGIGSTNPSAPLVLATSAGNSTTGALLSSFVSSYTGGSTQIANNFSVQIPNSASSGFIALRGNAQTGSGNPYSAAGLTGIGGNVTYQASSGTVTTTTGGNMSIYTTSGGSITNAYGMNISALSHASTGTISNARGINIASFSNSGGGSITTAYGLYIGSQTAATNNYGIWADAGDWILDEDGDGGAGGATGGGNIILGEGQDLELYHDGTNSYIMNNTGDLYIGDAATDDVILSNGGGNVGIGSTAPGYKLDLVGEFNLTDAIRVAGNAGTSGYLLTSSGGGANTWTDPATLAGTNWWDNTLNVLHPKNEYASIVDLVIGGTSTASADTQLFANGSAVFNEQGNAANFRIESDTDANALFVNGTSNNVGIGTNTPGAKLDVNGNILLAGTGTIDTRAAGTLTIGGTTQTGLTLGRVGVNSTLTGAVTTITGGTSVKVSNLTTNGVVYTSGGDGTLNSEALLAISRGGTNSSATPTAGGVTYGTGTAYAFTSAGTSGQFLVSNGAGAPTWTSTITATALPFSGITSGTNTQAAMVVGTGASLDFTGSGTINSSSLLGGTWAAPGTIGSGTPNTGAFTTLSANSTVTFSGLTAGVVHSNGSGVLSNVLGTTNYIPKWTATGLSTTSLLFDDGTNIGIGSTSPGYQLDLVGEFNLTDAIRVAGNAGTSSYVLTSSGGGANTWTDPTTLGINWWDNTLNVLHPRNEYASIVDLVIGGTSTASADTQLFADGAAVFNEQGNAADFRVESDSDANALFINGTSNNIGIGTNTPGAKLQVAGNIFPSVDDTHSLGSDAFRWADLYLGPASLHVGTSGNEAIVGYDTVNSHLIFDANGDATQEMRIESTGNVGIGTTGSLAARLHVYSGSVDNVATFRSFDDLARFEVRDDNTGIFFNAKDGYASIGGGNSLSAINLNINTSTGYVGIGTTAPEHSLDVNKATTGRALVLLKELGDQDILTASDSAGTTRFRMANNGTMYADEYADVGNSAYFLNPAGGITSMAVLSNVGIGTSTPGARLDVRNSSTEDILNLFDGSTEVMTVLDGGNVGIGDTSPDAKLEILATTEQLRLTHTDGTVDSRFTVDASGNLTIDNTGTKTVVGDDLQINGNDILDSGATSRITLGSNSVFTNTTTNFSGTTTIFGSSLATFNTSAALTMGATTTLTLGSNSTLNGGSVAGDDLILQGTSNVTRTNSYVLLQPTAGNVGIGTTTPGAILDVRGPMTTDGSLSFQSLIVNNTTAYNASPVAGQMFYNKYNSGGSYAGMGGITVGKLSVTDGNYSSYMALHTRLNGGSVTEQVRIASDGNVGIGTSTVPRKLTVAGGARITTSTAVSDTLTLCTDSTGDIEFKTGACTVSSAKYKENVENIAYGLETINLMRPVFFEYNNLISEDTSGRTKRKIGFIAEEMDLIIPEVTIYSDGEIDGIDYAFLTSVLAKGIQELDAKVETIFTNLVASTANITNLTVQSLQIGGQTLENYIVSIINNQNSNNSDQLLSPIVGELIANSVITDSVTATGSSTLGSLLVQDIAIANNASVGGELTTESLVVSTNASVSGSLLAGLIESDAIVAQDATVAGTLEAGTLIANHIDVTSSRISALEAGIAQLEHVRATTADLVTATVSGTLYADNIYDFENKVATTLQQPGLLDVLLGNNENNASSEFMQDLYDTVNTTAFNASSSADLDLSFSELSMTSDDVALTGTALFVEQYLKVNGAGYISDSLAVGNKLFVGETMQIADGLVRYSTIDPANQILKIQPEGQGSIELLAGIVTIDDSGKVTVNGDLEVTGTAKVATLLTNMLKPGDFGNPFQVQVAGVDTQTNEVKKSRFEIINEVGTPVATFSAEGNADFAGKAKFGGGIGIASQNLGSNENNELTTDKTSGKATIKSGASDVTIKSNLITNESLVYVTAVGSTGNQVIYVKAQTADDTNTPEQEGRFVVGFDNPTTSDVSFNWWIVN